jgi:uncharacterized protein
VTRATTAAAPTPSGICPHVTPARVTRLVTASLASWIAAALTGCASGPPLHYYTLTEVAPATRLTAPADVVAIRLDRVTVPTELDRTQLVRKLDDTRLQILEDHRWAAPVDDMIRRVLADDLAARLPPSLIADPNEPSVGERRQSLAVDVRELYGDRSCVVTLRAVWTLKPPDSAEQSARGDEVIRIPPIAPCSGAEALPPAMNKALAQLSDRIAAAIAGGR